MPVSCHSLYNPPAPPPPGERLQNGEASPCQTVESLVCACHGVLLP